MSRSPSPRFTIGVLVDWLEDVYQNTVFSGILAAAEAADANVLCFAGGVLDAPTVFGRPRNPAYLFANPQTVDGLVVLSGTVGNHIGPARLAQYFERFAGMPISSVGIPLPGVSNFLVDNAAGMKASITHLIDVHERRNIAFIRGPEANDEAEARYQVYRDVLRARGLPFDASLVAPGDFRASSGTAAVDRFLDGAADRCDAIVAANDHMALGALERLQARRISIPRQVALVGFDDVEHARLAAVPLATVKQPLALQGRLAAESVLSRLRGSTSTGDTTLLPTFIPRASCGCDAARRATERRSKPRRDAFVPPPHHAEVRATSLDGGDPSGGPDRSALLRFLIGDAQQKTDGTFLAFLQEHLDQVSADDDIQAWNAALSRLREWSFPGLAAPYRARGLDLLDDARLVVAAASERTQGNERLRAEYWLRALRSAGEAILATYDVTALGEALAARLPALEIQTCFLLVHEPPHAAGGAPTECRLVLAHGDGHAARPDIVPARHPIGQFIPANLLPADRRYTFVVEPLFFQDQGLGFAVIEMGPRDGVVYETLRSHLSAALEGARLVGQIRDEARRREEQERQSRQAQKLEAVGRLAAGIAHEINTPLQYVRDSVEFVRESLTDLSSVLASYQDLRTKLDDDQTWGEHAREVSTLESTKDVPYLLENVPPAFDRMVEGVERVTAIVRSMKEFAHADTRDKAAADINKGIRNILTIARNEYKYVADLEAEFGDLPPVECYPGDLNQVILSIVVNAAHAIGDLIGTSGPRGRITVRTWRDGPSAVIAIADTGGGIPQSIQDRIFDPFFTTKEVGRGTGQGLAIAHDVVVGKHHGSLTFETHVGQGTTFFIRIPIAGGKAEARPDPRLAAAEQA